MIVLECWAGGQPKISYTFITWRCCICLWSPISKPTEKKHWGFCLWFCTLVLPETNILVAPRECLILYFLGKWSNTLRSRTTSINQEVANGSRLFCIIVIGTLLETNISPQKGTFEDDFPFPEVGYVSSLEGNLNPQKSCPGQVSSASRCHVSRVRHRRYTCRPYASTLEKGVVPARGHLARTW